MISKHSGNSLLSWTMKQGLFYNSKKHDREQVTHSLYNGGMLMIDQLAREEFLTQYARSIDLGEDLFISEFIPAGKIFRFYIDVDSVTQNQPLNCEAIKERVGLFQEQIRKFYPSAKSNFECIILIRDPTEDEDAEGRKKYKNGVHLLWPELYVDVHVAKMIRQACADKLLKTEEENRALLFPVGDERRSWNQSEFSLDSQVYNTGLRMPFSKKKSKCPECKGRKSKTGSVCRKCFDEGEVTNHCFYYPICSVDSTVDRSMMLVNKLTALKLTILTPPKGVKEKTPGYIEYPGAARYPEQQRLDGKGLILVSDLSSNDNKTLVKMTPKRVEVKRNSKEFQILSKLIKNYQPVYKDVFVQSAQTNAKNTYYVVVPGGEGKNYCNNVKRDHNNHTIYFYITHNGISQKCFCRCGHEKEGRIYGPCSEYPPKSIPPIPLVKEDQDILFKNMITIKTTKPLTTNIGLSSSFPSSSMKTTAKKQKKIETKESGGGGNNIFSKNSTFSKYLLPASSTSNSETTSNDGSITTTTSSSSQMKKRGFSQTSSLSSQDLTEEDDEDFPRSGSNSELSLLDGGGASKDSSSSSITSMWKNISLSMSLPKN